jgi:hypothetical protein
MLDPKEKEKIINMTNNALERFNREMNHCFPNPHPKMPEFINAISGLCRNFAAELDRIKKNKSRPPVHRKANIPVVPVDYFGKVAYEDD